MSELEPAKIDVDPVAVLKDVAKKALNKNTRTLLRKAWYIGNKYHCSVCDNHVRGMLINGYPFPVLTELDVIGGETVANDTCPVCFSNRRTRLLFEYLKRELGILDPKDRVRVMHVAPESGILVRLSANALIDYVPVDLNPEQYEGVGGITRCDLTAISYANNSFDIIICSHILEHIPDDRLAMRELRRVLKPSGTAILQVPISAKLVQTIEDPYLEDEKERERRFGQHDHVRIYGSDYPNRLREAGFTVDIFDPADRWGGAIVDKFRLDTRERIFLGRK